jgi:single-stranded DNA-binding protein
MFKIIVTKARMSNGYEDAPALRYSDSTDSPFVRFRIGQSVYDKKAKDERRFVNVNVKAFGYLVDRIRNMKLDAGSYVNIVGRYDEESWEDNGAKKSAPVIIIDEIEYGTLGDNGKQNGKSTPQPPDNPETAAAPDPLEPPSNFTGFESFDGANPYYQG